MIRELRDSNRARRHSPPTAAMARLLDLSLICPITSPISPRRRRARLAIVVEMIVRSKLRNQHAAISTIEGAYRLLLHFGETHSPCPDVADWIRREQLTVACPRSESSSRAQEG